MGKIDTTLSLMKASWQILKKDKELLFFPIISGICCLSMMAIFVVQALDHGWLKSFAGDATAEQKNMAFWLIFLFYYCNYLVIVFFNSAIIACAVIRMDGGNPTIADGLQAAVNRFPHIAVWLRPHLHSFLSSRPPSFAAAEQIVGGFIVFAGPHCWNDLSDHSRHLPISTPDHLQCCDVRIFPGRQGS